MIYLSKKKSVWAALLSQIKHRLLAHLSRHAILAPALVCGAHYGLYKVFKVAFPVTQPESINLQPACAVHAVLVNHVCTRHSTLGLERVF